MIYKYKQCDIFKTKVTKEVYLLFARRKEMRYLYKITGKVEKSEWDNPHLTTVKEAKEFITERIEWNKIVNKEVA